MIIQNPLVGLRVLLHQVVELRLRPDPGIHIQSRAFFDVLPIDLSAEFLVDLELGLPTYLPAHAAHIVVSFLLYHATIVTLNG
jgi:hypothetical protein